MSRADYNPDVLTLERATEAVAEQQNGLRIMRRGMLVTGVAGLAGLVLLGAREIGVDIDPTLAYVLIGSGGVYNAAAALIYVPSAFRANRAQAALNYMRKNNITEWSLAPSSAQ